METLTAPMKEKEKSSFRLTLNQRADELARIYYGEQLAKGRKIKKVEACNEFFQLLINHEDEVRNFIGNNI